MNESLIGALATREHEGTLEVLGRFSLLLSFWSIKKRLAMFLFFFLKENTTEASMSCFKIKGMGCFFVFNSGLIILLNPPTFKTRLCNGLSLVVQMGWHGYLDRVALTKAALFNLIFSFFLDFWKKKPFYN